MALRLFTNILLSHQANDAKTSKDAVKLSLETLKKELEDKHNYMNTLHEEYMMKFEAPRNENKVAYNLYLDENNLLKNEWIEKNNTTALQRFVATKPSQLLNFEPNTIYTQFSLPGSLDN